MKTHDIKGKIKEYFFVHPTLKLRVRQIEREVKVPLPSVLRYIKELEQEGILKSSHIANITVYSADRASKTFLLEKTLFNIKQLHTSGLIDSLVSELSNPTVVLFGSYSRGEDVENSDIDIYVETTLKKRTSLEKFENILKRRIQLFSYKSIHHLKNKELANNIMNGVTLNGFLGVFK